VPGDILLLVFAKDLLEKEKNCSIIGDVKCSKILFDYIKKNGGRPIMAKTGHSHIKECIKENDAVLAGEMSGHIFFADNYFGFDDALYAAVRLINILSKSEKKLSDIIDEFPKSYNTPEIRIECDDKEKFKIIDKVINNQKNKKYSDIDGIRVELENGWWLMRASNTQAAMVLRCEANSKKDLDEIISIVKNEIKKISPELSKQILA
ncbi:MAG: phosphomannomutase, partial [Rickettsiales bacterium]